MELTTILNRCHRYRGFVYENARFSADSAAVSLESLATVLALRDGVLPRRRITRPPTPTATST